MNEKPSYDELVSRLERLERRKITTDDLPIGPLQRKLERTWQPDGGVLLQAKSVSGDSLGTGTIVTGTERQRHVGGEVSAAGALVGGAGFTPVRTALGVYTVTFADPFTAPPALGLAVIATPLGGIVLTASPTTTGFTVNTFNTNTGALIDAAWTFNAIGLD